MVTHAYLVASGDTRLPANQNCWPAQLRLETRLIEVLHEQGAEVTRAHPFDPREGHGFISSQLMGMDVFWLIPLDSPVIVAEAVWQYSSHVLAGPRDRRGPVLTVANWESGRNDLVTHICAGRRTARRRGTRAGSRPAGRGSPPPFMGVHIAVAGNEHGVPWCRARPDDGQAPGELCERDVCAGCSVRHARPPRQGSHARLTRSPSEHLRHRQGERLIFGCGGHHSVVTAAQNIPVY